MKVFIMHKKGLSDRLQKILSLLCECKFVEDIEIITSEHSVLKFSTALENVTTLPNDFPLYEISQSQKSLYHKHFRAYEKIVASGDAAIIFEDDVLFDPPVLDKFVADFNTIPADWEFCFFGTGCKLTLPGTGFIKNNTRLKSKCCDSMVVHPAAAKRIYDDLKSGKAYMVTDWDLNYRFMKHGTIVYWYEPGIITQGSENGSYTSTVIPRSIS